MIKALKSFEASTGQFGQGATYRTQRAINRWDWETVAIFKCTNEDLALDHFHSSIPATGEYRLVTGCDDDGDLPHVVDYGGE